MILTHRRDGQFLGPVVLFAEEGNSHCGDTIFYLDDVGLQFASDDATVVELAYELYGDDAMSSIMPKNIVNSAEAWEDPDFLRVLDGIGHRGAWRTPDGAVVTDDYYFDAYVKTLKFTEEKGE